MFLYIICHFGIENLRKNLIGKVDDGNSYSFCFQVFSSFQTDKARTDHHCFFYMLFFYIRTDAGCIIRCTHFENAVFVHSFYREICGRSTYGNDQTIIRVGFGFSVFQIFCFYCFFLCMKSNRFPFGQYLHTGQCGKFFRCVYDKFFPFFDQTTDIIRQSASCIGDIGTFCDQSNLCASIFSFQFRCCFGSGCNTAND